MLSHLRLHRRGGASNPTSPSPDQQTSASPHSGHNSPFAPDSASPLDGATSSAGSSTIPPTLPPITRVTSAESGTLDFYSQPDGRPQQAQRSPYHGGSGFIGGVALANYRRDVAAQQTAPRPDANDGSTPISPEDDNLRYNAKAPIHPDTTSRLPIPQYGQIKPSFSTPTDLQNSGAGMSGRWPAVRASNDAAPPAPAANITHIEPQKGKKGLPFLKNPMSTLLMRRKNNQNVPDVLPLPIITQPREPSYDPRIRGTRVHDFSAPRRRNQVSNQNTVFTSSSSRTDLTAEQDKGPGHFPESRDESFMDMHPTRETSQTSVSAVSDSPSVYSPQTAQSLHTGPEIAAVSVNATGQLESNDVAPPVPLKDAAVSDKQLDSYPASLITHDGASSHSQAIYPSNTNRSRNVSISGLSNKDMLSSVPRHMKSTSSRFSFDMAGGGKQEKLLEEKHRQRELERQTTEESEPRDSRFDDFDEDAFDYDAMMDDDGLEERIPGVNADYDDEEEDFLVGDEPIPGVNIDYDDGEEDFVGGEEPIPGVNADYDDEEEDFLVEDDVVEDDHDQAEADPDNDQDNFAGFVFQRSNPTSSLASPRSAGLMGTPRDADGKVIGFAMTKDTPSSQNIPLISEHTTVSHSDQGLGSRLSGLGIQDMNMPGADLDEGDTLSQPTDGPSVSHVPQTLKADDLYYDDGMLGMGDEFAEELAAQAEYDAAPFDESIFDDNDTDQFGRPVPGAFAQAQSMRQAVNKSSFKRESDLTSSLSQKSDLSKSTTAHTSLSVDETSRPRRDGSMVSKNQCEISTGDISLEAPPASAPSQGSMAAYQAALAAAAHEAAASGKFRRSSTISQQEEQCPADDMPLGNLLHDDDVVSDGGYIMDDAYDSAYGNAYDNTYDDTYDDMYDFELDDDDIIAEANASALANDSDGWYGQEFGFYSSPMSQHNSSRATGPAESAEFGYGGFFGPKGAGGLDRSTSGRVISREPNLTPITERSEYSNRNSLMSLGIPALASGTPVLQSPGLAQLAMMGDFGDDQMTLSALLRLRSKAWGGSQISLSSSRDGSPQSERGDGTGSSWPQQYRSPPPGPPAPGHVRKTSAFSNVSRDSEPGSRSGSPTLTMDMPIFSSPPPAQPQPILPQSVADSHHFTSPPLLSTDLPYMTESPISAVSGTSATDFPVSKHQDANAAGIPVRRSNGKGHRRQKSSSDSISYTIEENSGETRWVMERRRTGESGKVELLEREVLDGGRI